MPKVKTKRSAAKRFEKTGTGKIRRRRANLSHKLSKKTSKRKRALKGKVEVSSDDAKRVKRMLNSG